jgi:hypothetical protein
MSSSRRLRRAPAGNDIYLAMERGEVEGRCGVTHVALRSVKPDWMSGDDFAPACVPLRSHSQG